MFENNEDEVHSALGLADLPSMIGHTGFGSWPNGCELPVLGPQAPWTAKAGK
jgi:hypothetical protein